MSGGIRGGIRLLALLPWLTAALAAPASAALIGYNDSTAWATAAAGGTLFLEDFESFNSDTSFRTTAVDTGGFTIEEVGGTVTATSVNLIDTTVFSFSGDEAIDGDAYALGWVNTFDNTYDLATSAFIEIVFSEPIFAWGADFKTADSTLGLLIFLFPEDGVDANDWVQCFVCSPDTGFSGFVADAGEMFTRIAILPAAPDTGGRGERFGMDNVVWGTISVPEPGAGVLFGLGMMGLAVVGRRRS